jgi:hypothetical protein
LYRNAAMDADKCQVCGIGRYQSDVGQTSW